jgi:hypothetical protein
MVGDDVKMAITYNAGTNTITVTGYTEAVPCTFHDIKLADMAGGWGVVSEAHGNQFFLTCHLQIGDGTIATYVRTLKEAIKFQLAHYQLIVKGNGHFQAGQLLNARPIDGSFIIIDWSSYISPYFGLSIETNGIVKLYGSYYSGLNTSEGYLGSVVFDNVNIEGIRQLIVRTPATAYLNDVRFENIAWLALSDCNITTGNRIEIYNSVQGIHAAHGYEYTLFDAKVFTSGHSLWVRESAILNMIDSIFDKTKIFGDVGGGTVKEKYSFDLKVTDKAKNAITGATVKVWDKNDTLVVNTTTDGNGEIATQYIKSNAWSGTGLPPPKTEYSPHTIEIKKAGYQPYQVPWTVEEKMKWLIRLLDVQAIQFMDNDLILQLAPESIENDRYIYTKV